MYLLSKGGKLTIKNNQGKFPIDIAADLNDWDLVNYIIKLSSILIIKKKADLPKFEDNSKSTSNRPNEENPTLKKLKAKLQKHLQESTKTDMYDIDESNDSVESENYEPKHSISNKTTSKKYTGREYVGKSNPTIIQKYHKRK